MAIAFTQLQLLQLLVWIVIKALFQIVIMLQNDNHNRIDQDEPTRNVVTIRNSPLITMSDPERSHRPKLQHVSS